MRKLFLLLAAVIITSHLSAQIGIYDIQVAPGVNWLKPKKGLDLDGEFGTTYDVVHYGSQFGSFQKRRLIEHHIAAL